MTQQSGTVDDIYRALLARQEEDAAPPPLTPRRVHSASLRSDIQKLQGTSDVLKASLHLLNDDIQAAHDLAQAHEESMTANLIHAVLHRREADYWNSKWWLSRIKHPLIQSIHGSTSQAKQFVDAVQACEEGRRSGGAKMSRRRQETEADEDELIWIQWQELVGLVEAAREEEVGKRAS